MGGPGRGVYNMFSLLRGLWQYFFRKDECFVVIIGLENAGKTVSKSIAVEILTIHT